MRAVIAKVVVASGALAAALVTTALSWALTSNPGTRSWSPAQAIAAGAVMLFAVVTMILFGVTTWRRQAVAAGPAVAVTVLLVSATTVAALFVLGATSVLYTPVAEIVR
jgi:hypothetical protein